MFSRLVSILIYAAVLLAGAGAPAIAYATGAPAVHLLEHADEHQQELVNRHADQSHDPDSQPIHTTHHHCAGEVTPAIAVPTRMISPARLLLRPMPVSMLASRTLAPLTEPPAA